MTATYSIPAPISTRYRFRSKPVDPRSIKVVIPTYKDWEGLRVTLDSLLALTTPPKQISVANDNPDSIVPAWLARYPVRVINYSGNRGPATARNKGFGFVEEIPAQKYLASLASQLERGGEMPDYVRNGYCPELKYRDGANDPDIFRWESEIDWVYFTDCGCTHGRR